MITTRPFQTEDFYQGDWVSVLNPKILESLEKYPAVTLIDDGIPVLVIGGQVLYKGIAQSYVLTSAGASKYPVRVFRGIQQMANVFFKAMKIRKVYILVDSTKPADIRFNQMMGFTHEYTMLDAGPDGQDMWGMSLVVGAEHVEKGEN